MSALRHHYRPFWSAILGGSTGLPIDRATPLLTTAHLYNCTVVEMRSWAVLQLYKYLFVYLFRCVHVCFCSYTFL